MYRYETVIVVLFHRQTVVILHIGTRPSGGCVKLTAVLLVTPVRTVVEAVTAESSNDAVDAIGTSEEGRGTL